MEKTLPFIGTDFSLTSTYIFDLSKSSVSRKVGGVSIVVPIISM